MATAKRPPDVGSTNDDKDGFVVLGLNPNRVHWSAIGQRLWSWVLFLSLLFEAASGPLWGLCLSSWRHCNTYSY
jgi:hypothetical protein